MKKLIALMSALGALGGTASAHSNPLDYDKLVPLDAEALGETGIKEAYERLLPSLARHIPKPSKLVEVSDNNAPSYAVIAGGTRYDIYSANTPQEQSWGNATYALFDIINRQLTNTPYKFYAFNGGNDLGGMLLTFEQYKAALAVLKKKTDWPYFPDRAAPWYGQAH